MKDSTLATFSSLAYLEPDELPGPALEGVEVTPIFKDDAEAYIFRREGESPVVAFRGTSSLKDALDDLKVRKKNRRAGEVHRGFLDYVNRLRDLLLEELKDDLTTVVTGHSLGGAAAQLFAFGASLQGKYVLDVVTFGSPRVGDRRWRKGYDLVLGDRTRRYRRVLDLVPHLPFKRWGYRHTMDELYIDRFGKIHEKIGWWAAFADKVAALTIGRNWDGTPEPLAAHSMAAYEGILAAADAAREAFEPRF